MFDVFGDLMDVANNTIHAILAEIAIVIFRGDAGAVPAVVMKIPGGEVKIDGCGG